MKSNHHFANEQITTSQLIAKPKLPSVVVFTWYTIITATISINQSKINSIDSEKKRLSIHFRSFPIET